MRSIPIPRYFVFTLEDSTWVVQRGADHVQELLTGKERSHSILDPTYAITDIELDLLMAQGIVERYDETYVWLRDMNHTEGVISMNTLERPFGIATYYFVEIDLQEDQCQQVLVALKNLGLDDRYSVTTHLNHVIVVGNLGEPFTKLSAAEDAQILLAPALHTMDAVATVRSLRFDGKNLPVPWDDSLTTNNDSLIRTLETGLKGYTIVCIDDEEVTHRIVKEALQTWGIEILSAYTGRDAINLIADADPALIVMDLKLPDMHGYEIVALVRNNPDLNHIPMIILSALTSETDRIFAFNIAKAIDYVVKPISADEIRRKVWRILN